MAKEIGNFYIQSTKMKEKYKTKLKHFDHVTITTKMILSHSHHCYDECQRYKVETPPEKEKTK